MHDPHTLAFNVPRPWPERRTRILGDRYWPPILTVWHKDPEKDGSDDSCGWSYPKLTEKEVEQAKKIGRSECEMEHAGLFEKITIVDEEGYEATRYMSKRDPASTTWLAFGQVAWQIWRWDIRPRDMPRILSFATSNLDGWYDTFAEARSKDEIERAFIFIARAYKQMRRPWWRHPRWHFWHWSISVPFANDLKRWLWSRCCRCGKRFGWGYSVVTSNWNSTGPRWFRGEKDVYHADCDRPRSDWVAAVAKEGK